MKVKLSVLLGVVVAMIASAAQAQLVIEAKKEKVAASEAGKTAPMPRLIFVGKTDYAMSRGMGRDIPLGEAVSQVVPKSWVVDFDLPDGARDLKRVVTWRGGSEWPYVLEDVLKQGGLAATVNADARQVTIGRYAGAKPSAAGVAKQVPNATPAAVAPARKVWVLRPDDETIRGAFRRWAKEAGWSVSWETEKEYHIQMELQFRGDFEDAVTAVAEALKNTEHPVQVVLYENEMVRVVPYGTAVNASYSPVEKGEVK